MVAIPEPYNFSLDAILCDYDKRARENATDNYGISVSIMGHECDRAIWYALRWACLPQPVPAIVQRRFDTGIREEERLLTDLMNAGFEVEDLDPATGAQFRVELCAGWLRGKLDGKVTGLVEAPKTTHVIECKSHNDKSFQALKKKGLPAYHRVQVQLYMHGTNLTRCLYVAVNKDSDELYLERVYYDRNLAEQLVKRAERIIASSTAPGRIAEDPEFYLCKFCDARHVCHYGTPARVNCRTCLSSSFEPDAELHCTYWNSVRTADEQRAGCTKHLFLPSLVPGEQIDSNETERTVTYKMTDGSIWIDGDAAAQ